VHSHLTGQHGFFGARWRLYQFIHFAGLTSVPNTYIDTQTDHGTCNICSNSPHRELLAVSAMQVIITPARYILVYTGWAKKAGPQTRSWLYFCQILTDLKNFTGRFLGKFAVKRVLKIPPAPCICCYTTLWNINVSKTRHYNDKLQGSVAAHLRSGGVVNNQIEKDLLLSVWLKKN